MIQKVSTMSCLFENASCREYLTYLSHLNRRLQRLICIKIREVLWQNTCFAVPEVYP